MNEFIKVAAKKPEAKRENRASQTQKTGPSQSISSPVEQILFLQRTIGNQAVGRLIKSGALQAKLKIGQPGDIYEQEADRVAEQVMQMPQPQVLKDPVPGKTTDNAVQRRCPQCTKKPGREEEEKILQAKEASDKMPEVTPEVENSISAIRGGGQPLSETDRAFFEPRFGHDFNQVRVHTGSHAAETAKSINARAFTVGKNIAFGGGQFAQGSHEGRKLLTHELTHTIQQGTNNISPSASTPHCPAADRFIKAQNQRSISSVVQSEEIVECDPILLSVQRKPDDPTASAPPVLDISSASFVGIPGKLLKGIQGPMPAGKVHEEGELRIQQLDLYHVRIDYGNSWVTIDSTPGQVYEFFVEQTRSLAPGIPIFDPSGLLRLGGQDQPAPQFAVRIAATYDVRIKKFQDETEGAPQLAVHERYARANEIAAGPLFGDVREHWVGESVVISVDESAIQIAPPSKRSDLNPHNFPDAKFAFWIDPVWTGTQLREKKVTIVASPGVGLEEGKPGMFNPAFSYGRKIVPEFVRVPHSAMVPAQGDPINAADFIGYQRISPGQRTLPFAQPQVSSEDLVVATSFSGITIVHPWSGAKVDLSPTNRSVGAAYAYQVLPPEGGHPGEIRVVVGPGVFVNVEEPAPLSWRQRFGEDTPLPPGEHPSWFGRRPIRGPEYFEGLRDQAIEVHIVEVLSADQVPLQGTPLNVNVLGSWRKPDAHQWIKTSDLASTMGFASMDVMVGMIPIVGDLVDIGEFFWALGTDHDRWGRPVTTADKVLMGIGAIIGLIPLVGGVGSLLRGGTKAAVKIADAAASVGKSADELELILWQLRGVVKGEDAAAVDDFIKAAQRGEDLAVEEVEKLQDLLGRVGAGDLITGHRVAGAAPGILDVRHVGFESLAEASDWRRSLNAETRAYLQTAPEVSKVYEQMDEGVRLVLTKCGSFCLPPVPPTPAQQAAIKRLLIVADAGPDDVQIMRTFLHKASNLDKAIQQLSEIATPAKLRRFLRRHVDMADAALLARDAWRTDPAFKAMREEARTLVRNGMSVDQLSKIMRQAARAGEEGPEFLRLVKRLWHKQPRPAGTAELLGHLASGGTAYRNSEWMLRYFQRGRAWDGLEAFDFSGGRWAARVKGETIQFRSWQRFESEEFIAQMATDYSSGRTTTKWVFEPGSPLGSTENIQAAGQQALQDALRRGDPRVTQEMVDFVSSNLARTIDVPAARQFTRLDVQRVSSTLSALEGRFPILRDLPLEVSALQRVIAKGPDINFMKGQLLEEFMAISVRKSLKSPAGRKALGLGRVQGELLFIEGHRIALGGRQFTDGVIAVRRGDKLEILIVFEAKSGHGSAGGLVSSVQTVRSMKNADKLELFNFIRDEMPEQLHRYLAKHHPSMVPSFMLVAGKEPRLIVRTNLGPHASREAINAQVTAIQKSIPEDVLVDVATAKDFRRSAEGWIKTTEIGGQVRRDVERVYGAVGTSPAGRQKGTRITIDGQETEAFLKPSQVQFRGVVPSDVDTDYIEKTLKGLGYRFESENMSIAGQDLIDLTEALNTQLRPRIP